MKRLGAPPYICLITEGRSDPQNYKFERQRILETVRSSVSDGARLIQIREKLLPARLVQELAFEAVRITEGTGASVFINERADIAFASGAAGVHLPEAAIPPQFVRHAFPRNLVIGVSSHSLEAARHAAAAGADYIFFGPVFETPGKSRPTGLEILAKICRELDPFPVIAIGGIDDENCEEVMGVGASGIAAIRALHTAESRQRLIERVTTRRGVR